MSAVQAQEGTNSAEQMPEPRVIYYGTETTFDEIEDSKLGAEEGALYCAQILTPEIMERGFDSRIDYIACFDSDEETRPQREENASLIAEFGGTASLTSFKTDEVGLKRITSILADKLRQYVCGRPHRGTMFVGVVYSGSLGDVCLDNLQVNPGGQHANSVWLVGSPCSAIRVTMNKYPWPAYQYVDFSSSAYGFLYVTRYEWFPPCPT